MFFRIITWLGNWQVIIVLFALVFIWLLSDLKTLSFFLFASLVPIIISHFLKLIFKKPRRHDAMLKETTYAFPSSHATIAVSFYGFLMLYFLKNLENLSLQTLSATFFLSLIVTVCYSRIYLKVHDLSDVTVGVLLGITGLIPYLLYY